MVGDVGGEGRGPVERWRSILQGWKGKVGGRQGPKLESDVSDGISARSGLFVM